MSIPTDKSVRLAQEVHASAKAIGRQIEALASKVNARFDGLCVRLDRLDELVAERIAHGRKIAARVSRRIEALDARIAALEESRQSKARRR